MRTIYATLLLALVLVAGCEPKAPSPVSASLAEPDARQSPEPLAARPVHQAIVEVASVTDGDTFRARLRDGSTVAIRLQGLDCPEVQRNSTCKTIEKKGGMMCDRQIELGHEATGVAIELLPQGSRVTLESAEGEGMLPTGGFGRRLAYVRLPDGRDFGLAMIEKTECKDFGERYPHPRMEAYRRVQ